MSQYLKTWPDREDMQVCPHCSGCYHHLGNEAQKVAETMQEQYQQYILSLKT